MVVVHDGHLIAERYASGVAARTPLLSYSVAKSFTNALVKPEEREYLRTLPSHFRIEFQLNDEQQDLLLVHGSPRKINEYLFEDRDEKSLLRIMENARADILCFGHTHKPYHRILTSGDGLEQHY